MTKQEEQRLERLGQTRTNKDGLSATVISYKNERCIQYKYHDIDIIGEGRWEHFNKGKFSTPIEYYKQNRIGEKRVNKFNRSATCIEYLDSYNILIQFDDTKETMKTTWTLFNRGMFSNNKIGLYGEKLDLQISKKDGRMPKEYDAWHSMFKRCYEPNVHAKRETYIDCTVCPEWFLYSNFIDWIQKQSNYDKWLSGGKTWHLDKDILIKNNKIYSPETCCLVPNKINGLLLRCNASRGEYPIGVYYDKYTGLYKAQCENQYLGRQISLGFYETPDDAFYKGYKPYKEKLIKKMAQEEFDTGNISEACYNALMNYIVEITD